MFDQLVSETVLAEVKLPEARPRPLVREECDTPAKRLAYVAQWLEAGALPRGNIGGFSMGVYKVSTLCGTVCCIAGAISYFFGDERKDLSESWHEARQLMELNLEQMEALCRPAGWFENRGGYTAAQAARCIRNYLVTGEIRWS